MSQCLNPECLNQNPSDTKFCQQCGSKLLLAERYRAIKIIGQGGFGRTFQAVDEFKPSQAFCVIKQFFPEVQDKQNMEKAAELFAKEAVRLEALGKHPQIPELLAFFTQDNRQYLIQEFIEGQNLQQELETVGAFNETQIWELLNDLLPVLEFIHSQKVIHRDIKPDNIIKQPISSQKKGELVLVDFGAAKFATRTALAVTGTVIGSAGYAAPEQAIGKSIFASDIYSLGVTCIHLLTQVEPFELFDVSENDWVWRDFLISPISDPLGNILDRMIVGATKKRFQSATEIMALIKPNDVDVSLPKKQVSNLVDSSSILEVNLNSERGVDYSKLCDLLATGKWREADIETAKLMLKITNRENRDKLNINSINHLPCTDLRTINQLWVKYSNGKFGFSAQKEIWENLPTQTFFLTYEKLGDRLGWHSIIGWTNHDNLIFDLEKAPYGHLPAMFAMSGNWVWFMELEKLFSAMVKRLNICQI
ncbi:MULTISPECIES: GUN4 domain-containing protein [Okeania]|uniref:non-specific serine/threonine protein kinase n=1 Tax=Okeania hirsuta TaxID=1458930 RepID=A0A3N6N965_9CYAN|nr:MULTISPECIES: GUN4 domain-containing protein [Okeania]NET11784.1 protein kinase [Okeania sp. SIO1H6]NES75425.1 protein kinase [Okeania sp. SIO1H4]NES92315.1 protein kinase [Okeania sp. SIO2B9]NET17846.1 protein kinase [Okeania sp. SIO1H5]NET77331.1 protein kinase [Okeania sp. SIO1F9]